MTKKDFAKPLNKTLAETEGNTKDIVKVLLNVVKTRPIDKQTVKFSKRFTPDIDGLKDLWYWTRHEIKYKEDPSGIQWIKEPARLVADGVGDCKSMTLFNVSVMMNLGIKWKIRFASYASDKVFTHVYPVGILDGQEVIVDSVWTSFDREKSYTHKKDYDMTKIQHLAGIGGYSIGALETLEQVAAQLSDHLLTDDITTMSQGEFARFITAESLKARALHATGQLATDLRRAVQSVESGVKMAGIGALSEFLTVAQAQTAKAFTPPILAFPADALNGYSVGKINVKDTVKKAGAVIKKTGQVMTKVVSAPVKAVVKVVQTAWQKIMNWIFKEALPKAGAYFLLLFAKPLTQKLQAKAANQRKLLGFIASVTGQSEAALLAMIETGLMKQTGKTAAQLLEGNKQKVAGIGFVLSLAAVSTAVKVVMDIIQKIMTLFKKNDAPSVEAGVATAEEIAAETAAQAPAPPATSPAPVYVAPTPQAASPAPPVTSTEAPPQYQTSDTEREYRTPPDMIPSPPRGQSTQTPTNSNTGGGKVTVPIPSPDTPPSSGGGSSMVLLGIVAMAAMVLLK